MYRQLINLLLMICCFGNMGYWIELQYHNGNKVLITLKEEEGQLILKQKKVLLMQVID